MNVNMDVITRDGLVTGSVANQLASGGSMNIGRMRPYINKQGIPVVSVYVGGDAKNPKSYKTFQVNGATLRRDEWKALDEAIVRVGETRLGGIQDLISNGLVYNLGNAMGTTVLEWHDMSDAFEAELTMDGVSKSKGDRPTFQHNYLPIPIIHVDYEINARVLEMSRALGNPLDTTSVERATRKINERLENMLFRNETYSFGEKDARNRNTIYSYTNHPDRNQVTLSTSWTDSAKTAKDIIDDVQAMKAASIAAKHYGPWSLYVPTQYETRMDDDYDVNGNSLMTIRERIMKIAGITNVKISDQLSDDNVVLVQMTSDVVRLVRGLPIRNVQWKTEGDMVGKYKLLTIQIPQVRSDNNGNTGIVHLA